MNNKTLQQLRDLKLTGMADALQRQLEQVGTYAQLDFTERIQLMLSEELLCREQRKHQRCQWPPKLSHFWQLILSQFGQKISQFSALNDNFLLLA